MRFLRVKCVYLVAYIKGGKVYRIDIELMRPSEEFIARKAAQGVTVECYTIKREVYYDTL